MLYIIYIYEASIKLSNKINDINITMENWTLHNRPFTSSMIGDYVGFTYEIINLTNERAYIGKKLFHKPKWLPITKKRKKRKKVLVESDWRDYWGSCKELLDDIEKLGRDKFERKILRLCLTKGDLSYFETREQIIKDVLISPHYYNSIIQCRIHSKHLSKNNLES